MVERERESAADRLRSPKPESAGSAIDMGAAVELTPAAGSLIEEVSRVFHETGRWPVWQFIDRFLDRADHPSRDLIDAVSPDVVQRPDWLRPQSEIRLTLPGLALTARGASDIALFIDVLTWCADREAEADLGPPDEAIDLVLRSDDYRADRKRRGLTTDPVTLTKAYQLLSIAGLAGSGGFNVTTGEWSTLVDERVRPYRGIRTLADYLKVTASVDRAEPSRRRAAGREQVDVDVQARSPNADPARVFVVHGRNAVARDAMFAFLRAIALRPVEWSQAIRQTGKGSPYIGEILDAAFADAQAVVVLLTPDEVAYLRSEYASGESDPDTQPATQPRPNVLFEAGMAVGRHSERVILVELGTVRPFSDVAGRHAVRLDDSATKRKELAQRLETAGCTVDVTGDAWLSAGDFTPPPAPGGGLPLGRKVPGSASRSRVRIDLRYHYRSQGGRLEIINLGTETVFDLDLQIPPDIQNLHVVGDLPIAKLPSGKSAKLIAIRTMGPGRDHFDVRITGRTEDGEPVAEDVFLSLID